MTNLNKIMTQKLPISYYMNFTSPCYLWKPLELVLILQKNIENENFAIKQTLFDEIKWLICC